MPRIEPRSLVRGYNDTLIVAKCVVRAWCK